MEDPPELSVVIAARNAVDTLPAQLDALAAQVASIRWEVIVADNGSEDGTQDLVRARARDWPRLRLVSADQTPGAGHARNLGAMAARGRWLAFCDADDVVDTGWVAALATALSDSALVAGRLEWRRLNDAAARRSRALPQQDSLQSTAPLGRLWHASASNLAVHAEVFHALGGFDVAARYLQDTDLCWRAQLSGVPLTFSPDAMVHMRLRRGLRAAWRQGRNTGEGERWLTERYAELADRAGDPTQGAPGPQRSRVGRVVRRAGLVAGQAARIRERGDLAAWCWDLGFGMGYASGGLPHPDPYTTPDRHTQQA